jgi:cyclopropane-fatty-acyl-phospholipid synthase
VSAGRGTLRLREALARALPERPFRVELWDGSALQPTNGDGGPTFTLRSPRAPLACVACAGSARARPRVRERRDRGGRHGRCTRAAGRLHGAVARHARKARLVVGAALGGALRSVPRTPTAELRPRGQRHSLERDRRAVTHHYDVSNEFFRLILGESMTYSCAIFSRGARTLEEAQRTKLELVCRKLGLCPGARVLDVGCGWGSFALHAAREHGVHVTGITLPEPQAALARERAVTAGLAERIEIRLADYRELARHDQFDAIASIGMVEHVGSINVNAYARQLAAVLRPGGRLLNQGIARLRQSDPEAGPVSERFVFPDAAPLHVSRVLIAIEAAGLEPTHVEGFRLDYAPTLHEWARNLDQRHEQAEALAGPERMRIWRLYLTAARRGFENGFTSVFQIVAQQPHERI